MNETNTKLDEPLVFTARQFAEKVSLSYETVLRLIKRKKLRCLPHTRHKRIPATELDRFLKS